MDYWEKFVIFIWLTVKIYKFIVWSSLLNYTAHPIIFQTYRKKTVFFSVVFSLLKNHNRITIPKMILLSTSYKRKLNNRKQLVVFYVGRFCLLFALCDWKRRRREKLCVWQRATPYFFCDDLFFILYRSAFTIEAKIISEVLGSLCLIHIHKHKLEETQRGLVHDSMM